MEHSQSTVFLRHSPDQFRFWDYFVGRAAQPHMLAFSLPRPPMSLHARPIRIHPSHHQLIYSYIKFIFVESRVFLDVEPTPGLEPGSSAPKPATLAMTTHSFLTSYAMIRQPLRLSYLYGYDSNNQLYPIVPSLCPRPGLSRALGAVRSLWQCSAVVCAVDLSWGESWKMT